MRGTSSSLRASSMQSGENEETDDVRAEIEQQVCEDQRRASPKRRKIRSPDADQGESTRLDPAEVFGADFLQVKILRLLDAHSLARAMVVSRRWLALAKVDALWQPLCPKLWKGRVHLPLDFLISPQVPWRQAYAMTQADMKQVEITPREACARTWEIRLKPTCGSYWTLLDPTHKGKSALKRYLVCNGNLEADPGDPIWGGQESMWKIVYPKGDDKSQHVRINKWPLFKVNRLANGGWYIENKFAIYSTVADVDTVKSLKDMKWRCGTCGRGDAAGASSSSSHAADGNAPHGF